jgi:hypothetical protein
MSTKHLLNIGQTVWDKIEVLLGTSQEFEEPHGNMMRTDWEQVRKKTKKNSKRKKLGPSWMHATSPNRT